jgi:6-phosphogluconate dehydrogenase
VATWRSGCTAQARRIRSREENNFTGRMLSIMRNTFGGHAVKKD